MKPARLAVIGLAVGAGLVAAMMAGNMAPGPQQPVAVEPVAIVEEEPDAEVLIAKYDIPIGGKLDAGAMEWRAWPEENLSPRFITRSSEPDALESYAGAIATLPVYAGEPFKQSVLAKEGRGFMSAILPSGKRAISVRVRNEARAAGFILPNDRIDVILTYNDRTNSRNVDNYKSRTILRNIRVLAIDQTFEERDGEKYVSGEIATLELLPDEAELLALGNQMGEISLSLRSIADIKESDEEGEQRVDRETAEFLRGRPSGGVRMIKYGIEVETQ